MKPETAENVLLVAIGVPLVLIGFLVAALVERREKPQAQERITIMKARSIPIGRHATRPGSPRFSHLIGE
jgi:hypothetical protein